MGGGSHFSGLDELRAHLYCSGNVKGLSSLPPAEDSFAQHMLRVLHQLYTWKRALDGLATMPSILEFGWVLEDGNLKPRYMTKPHCPPNIVKTASCHCVKGRCVKSCPCAEAGPCSLACLCGGNPNRCDRARQAALEDDMDSSSESESSDIE